MFECNNEIVVGVVFNLVIDEFYMVEKGGGIFFNDCCLCVVVCKEFFDSVIICGVLYFGCGNYGKFFVELCYVMGEVFGICCFGVVLLDFVYVVVGCCDGYWEMGFVVWDIVVGILLIREVGGWVFDFDGKINIFEIGFVVVGNEYIYKVLLEVMYCLILKG